MKDTRNKKEGLKSYITAAGLLPQVLWKEAFMLNEEDRPKAEEFRLRLGMPLGVTVNGRTVYPGTAHTVTAEDLESVIARATGCSVHSSVSQMRNGFITSSQGHRIGICGTLRQGEQCTVQDSITSLNIRIAKQVWGIADGILSHLVKNGFESVLILSPPGGGKTTLIRDMCRQLSSEMRVSVADCRFEISGGSDGLFDLGMCDIMRGGGKAQCIDMLLKAMSPQIIALDEITSQEDIDAMIQASYTGCAFIASAHGGDIGDLHKRPLYRKLVSSGIFGWVIVIEKNGGGRNYTIFKRGETNGQNYWRDIDNNVLLGRGDILGQGYARTSGGT